MILRDSNVNAHKSCFKSFSSTLSGTVVIPSNRYFMVCLDTILDLIRKWVFDVVSLACPWDGYAAGPDSLRTYKNSASSLRYGIHLMFFVY